MRNCAKEGTDLVALVRQAIPFCQEAERLCPRTGPGRRPTIPDWVLAVLIVIAVLKLRKSKSAQFRFIKSHRQELLAVLRTDCLPGRTTYFERYRRAWKLYEVAIRLAGQFALKKDFTDAHCVAVDKSVIPAQGPPWNKRHVARGRVPRGAIVEIPEAHQIRFLAREFLEHVFADLLHRARDATVAIKRAFAQLHPTPLSTLSPSAGEIQRGGQCICC